MVDNAGTLYILNDTLEPVHKLESMNTSQKHAVYEVIRIIKRVPLFLEDHYVRLKRSLNLLGLDLNITIQTLKQQIQKLVDANQQLNCNVKVMIYSESDIQNCFLYISKSYYPSMQEINAGVPVHLVYLERENPNVKLMNQTYKDIVNKKIKANNVFEVLLVNSKNKITEGSRSNVFFVKGSNVFTTPSEYILKGITRQYIIDTCKKIGLTVVETLTSVDELCELEGVFISGTSIKVLPVSNVDAYRYNSSVHPTITAIRDAFDKLIDDYIDKHK
ncbi:MAG: branched-chain amino acid aminotransferase [Clostridiales bacterium]|jgi:branched-chain amino acid aminotransferase|nr:branched-chain amino acid aminotransferase [Clostridiales bacterium]MDK2934368.1 branched-chain amino acid aminotransferase [Clostridiales bacterium]